MTKKEAAKEGFKVKLDIAERINLLNTLPEQGGFATARLVRQLRERLSMNEAEVEKYTYEVEPCDKCGQKGGRLFRDLDDAPNVGYTFSGFEVALIVGALKRLDKEEKMSPVHIPLWELFVEPASTLNEAEEDKS